MKYKLNTQPYKGTKDYYPKDMFKRNYIFDIWKETAIEFGYEEYDTPLLEEANLYKAKSGEELGSTQLYNFLDKGDREVAIRPEMTPSLARIVAAKINELPKPIRWFNIGKYYRYEKPQRGRTREFFQLNIDILGIDNVNAEIEIFQFIDRVMKKFNTPADVWCIYINNRKLLDYFFNTILQLDVDLKDKVAKAIDNYKKIKKEEFPKYLEDLGLSEAQTNQLLTFLECDTSYLKKLDNDGARDILQILDKCKELGIKNIEFRPYIIRGLAYYTGTVMELFDIGSLENPRALFGGGRYDDLLTMFDKPKLPAFGLGWGNITTEDFLETYSLFPKFKSLTQVLVTQSDRAFDIASKLRNAGLTVETQLKDINLGKQLEYANKKGIRYTVISDNEQLILKDLETGNQFEGNIEDIAQRILEM
jgi:histidyl-tRNA synthetase